MSEISKMSNQNTQQNEYDDLLKDYIKFGDHESLKKAMSLDVAQQRKEAIQSHFSEFNQEYITAYRGLKDVSLSNFSFSREHQSYSDCWEVATRFSAHPTWFETGGMVLRMTLPVKKIVADYRVDKIFSETKDGKTEKEIIFENLKKEEYNGHIFEWNALEGLVDDYPERIIVVKIYEIKQGDAQFIEKKKIPKKELSQLVKE